MLLTALALFIAGLLIGSFIGVVADRLPRGESFLTGRSRCDQCGAQIAAYDNVPAVSWLWLRGRCRACGERISVRHPLTEVGLGALWAATYLILHDDATWEIVLGLLLCAILVTVTLTDLDQRVIPNAVVGAGAVAAIVGIAIGDASALDDRLIAAAAAGGALFVIVMLYPRGMGMGDVKLVAMMGLYLGRAIAPAVLIGFLVGAVVGIGMIARRGAAARKQAIPFGPFLALGGVIGLWVGDDIVQWYLDEFFPSD
jgi:leader peptidase (prepilin peptidase)/N-methyltransferase